jgi:hypothetical protein
MMGTTIFGFNATLQKVNLLCLRSKMVRNSKCLKVILNYTGGQCMCLLFFTMISLKAFYHYGSFTFKKSAYLRFFTHTGPFQGQKFISYYGSSNHSPRVFFLTNLYLAVLDALLVTSHCRFLKTENNYNFGCLCLQVSSTGSLVGFPGTW